MLSRDSRKAVYFSPASMFDKSIWLVGLPTEFFRTVTFFEVKNETRNYLPDWYLISRSGLRAAARFQSTGAAHGVPLSFEPNVGQNQTAMVFSAVNLAGATV